MSSLIKEPDKAPLVPARLGKYELLRHLATGGMAEIFLARVGGIEGFEKIVVVKRILQEFASNKEFVHLFLDEARLAATLHHPNIAQVYDVGIVGGQYFFAMEFVHGQDVRALIKRAIQKGQQVPLSEAISVALGVCAGLHYAHEKIGFDGKPLGIIHRDVSPSNILVTYDGSVKLVDFGIAKATTRTVETRYGSIRGKLNYLSPEQCRCEPLDRRADVFALSIVLYELSTCTKLFGGQSDFETMKRIVEQPAPPPSSRRPGYPPALEKIVVKGLARNRDQRWQTAQELQLALEEFARQERLAVSPIGLARYMEQGFAEEITAWREAERQGKGLGEHLAALPASTHELTPSGLEELEVSRSPAQAATKAEIPTGLRRQTGSAAGLPLAAGGAPAARRPLALYLGGAAAAVAVAGLVVGLALRKGPPPDTRAVEATLQVVSDPPGATVAIDGARQELLTPNTFRVRRGTAHKVRVELPGYRPVDESVALGATDTARALRVELAPLKAPGGKVIVRTNAPKGAWKLDGVPVGDGAGQLTLDDVAAGSHRLTFEAPGFERREEFIDVQPRGSASLTWELKPVAAKAAPRPATPRKAAKSGDLNDIGGWPPR